MKNVIIGIAIAAAVAGIALAAYFIIPAVSENKQVQAEADGVTASDENNEATEEGTQATEEQEATAITDVSPYAVVSTEKIMDLNGSNNEWLPSRVNGWLEKGASFEFAIPFEGCEAFCGPDVTYSYDIATGETEKTLNPLMEEGWRLSPDERRAIRIRRVEDHDDESGDGGTIEMMDIQSGNTYVIAKETFLTGAGGTWVSEKYTYPRWSPDSKWIVMYDKSQWDENGPMVVLFPSDAADLSGLAELGQSIFIETERAPYEQYFIWSPDSTYFIVNDNTDVFSAAEGKRIYESNRDERVFAWSPKSDKVLIATVSDDEDTRGLSSLSIMNPDGTDRVLIFKDVLVDSLYDIFASWSEDGTQVLVSMNDQLVIYDLESKMSGLVAAQEGGFRNIAWNKDGRQVLFDRDNAAWLLEYTRE
ncbi:MAG: hypothetical protein ABIG66_01125 [Candidatus Kerfeldbacteria bacterium]